MGGIGAAKPFLGALLAHRGTHDGGAPENTIEAVQSLDSWVDGVEVDVRFTSDGVPMMMHDATVDRTTDGTGAIVDMTAAEVKALTVTGGDVGDVPTLAEFLAAAPSRLSLYLDCKIQFSTADQVNAIKDVVVASGQSGRVVILCQNVPALEVWRATDTDLAAGLVNATNANIDAYISAAETYNAPSIWIYIPYSDHREAARKAEQAGLSVGPGTADTVEERRAAVRDRASFISTDVSHTLEAFAST